MAFSRRQIWSVLSTLYLLSLTALAAYALHDSNSFSLPVPNILSALALALPTLCALALETSMSMTSTHRTKPALHVRPYVLQVVSAIFLVYEAVIATLAGTHLAPAGSLDCALSEQWLHLFRAKDESSIRSIQDRFDCCGLRTTRHMAWPFPEASAHRTDDACIVRYERSTACLEPWREAERRVAGILLAVSLGVFVWQMLFLYIGPSHPSPSWLPSTLQLPNDDDRSSGQLRITDYRDDEEPTTPDGIDREVSRLNADSRLASHVERGRHETTRIPQNGNEWAD